MMAYDFIGELLMEGDVVVRAKVSNLILHKILKINKKSIILSCHTDGKISGHRYIIDSSELSELKKHNDKLKIEITSAHKLIKINNLIEE